VLTTRVAQGEHIVGVDDFTTGELELLLTSALAGASRVSTALSAILLILANMILLVAAYASYKPEHVRAMLFSYLNSWANPITGTQRDIHCGNIYIYIYI